MTYAQFNSLKGGGQLFQLLSAMLGVTRRGTPVDRSGTANGASQTVAAANTSRKYFSFQNPSGNSGTFWVSIVGGTATADSPQIEVKPGQGFVWSGNAVPTTAITLIGTNAEKWTAWEF